MIIVTTLRTFTTKSCALTPRLMFFPGWQGNPTNGSTAIVVHSTNKSRGSVGRSGRMSRAGGVGYPIPNRVGGFFY